MPESMIRSIMKTYGVDRKKAEEIYGRIRNKQKSGRKSKPKKRSK